MQQYQEQISPEATHATAPEELHPLASAFGGDIGKALQAGGDEIANRVQSLSLHMARMNYYRNEAQRADLLNNYKTQSQTKIYGDPSDPNATVTSIGGQVLPEGSDLTLSTGSAPSNIAPTAEPVEIPAGVYNRKGYAAAGSLQDVDNWHAQVSEQIMNQAKGLGIRNISKLKSEMDTAWSSERMSIAKHEAGEVEQAQQKAYFTGMQLDADNAVTKQDPISLGRVIDSINSQSNSLNDSQGKAADDPMRELTSNKFISQALNNSMTTNLKASGGNPAQFQSIIDRLHDDGKINDAVYDNSQNKLDHYSKVYQRMYQTNQQKSVISNRMNVFQSLGNGKLSENTSPSVIADIAASDPQLGNAVNTVISAQGNYKLERNDKQDIEFQKNVTDMLNSSSQDQLSNYLLKTLSSKNANSQEHLNIMVNALMKHAKTLPMLDGEPNSPIPQNLSSTTYNALNDWADKAGLSPKDKTKMVASYLDGMSKSIVPRQNYEAAIKGHLNSVFPQSSVMENPPNEVVDDKEIKTAYPQFNKDIKVHAMIRWEEPEAKDNTLPLEKAAQQANKSKEGNIA